MDRIWTCAFLDRVSSFLMHEHGESRDALLAGEKSETGVPVFLQAFYAMAAIRGGVSQFC